MTDVGFIYEIVYRAYQIENRAEFSSREGQASRGLHKELEEEGVTIGNAWTAARVYAHCMEGTLPVFLLGKANIREDQELIQNFGVLSSRELAELPSTASAKKGAILCEEMWGVFVNDMAIHAIIQSRKICHLAMAKLKVSDIWNLVKLGDRIDFDSWFNLITNEKLAPRRKQEVIEIRD